MRDLKSILITGGAGFVGSSLVRNLLKEDDLEKLIVLDKLVHASSREHLIGPDQDPRFLFVEGDINDRSLLDQLLAEHKVTGVLHLAEESRTDAATIDTVAFVTTNIGGTATMIEATRAAQVPLLHCSTDQVYGNIDSPAKAKENQPLKPNSAYAVSKASADLLCLAACHSHKQDILITRSTNNYGPRQSPNNLIPYIIDKASRDEPIPIPGNGLQIRDWLHVDDHCQGLIAAWRRGKAGNIYHFAGHCERTNIGMARSVLDFVRKPHSLLEKAAAQPGQDARYALDTEKAMMWFGWTPQKQFKDHFSEVMLALSSENR